MITTVTPNPSLDRTLHLSRFLAGEVNRASRHDGGAERQGRERRTRTARGRGAGTCGAPGRRQRGRRDRRASRRSRARPRRRADRRHAALEHLARRGRRAHQQGERARPAAVGGRSRGVVRKVVVHQRFRRVGRVGGQSSRRVHTRIASPPPSPRPGQRAASSRSTAPGCRWNMCWHRTAAGCRTW